MYRGTTPEFKFTLPFQASEITLLNIAMAQNGTVKISKALTDCTQDGNTLTLTLTESETLSLAAGSLDIQLRVGVGAKRLVSGILHEEVQDILKGGALADA